MANDVTLVPFTEGDAALLSRWLLAPHVAQWYPDPQEHLDWALCPPVGGERAAIVVNGARVGYLRTAGCFPRDTGLRWVGGNTCELG